MWFQKPYQLNKKYAKNTCHPLVCLCVFVKIAEIVITSPYDSHARVKVEMQYNDIVTVTAEWL